MADKYLSEQTLKKKLAYVFRVYDFMPYIKKDIYAAIEKARITDVEPVVRCSDCIFQGFLDSDYSGCFCERSREEIQPNDFCSHAVSWEQHKASLGGSKMDEEA